MLHVTFLYMLRTEKNIVTCNIFINITGNRRLDRHVHGDGIRGASGVHPR